MLFALISLCVCICLIIHLQNCRSKLQNEINKSKRELFEAVFKIDSSSMTDDDIDIETLLYITGIIDKSFDLQNDSDIAYKNSKKEEPIFTK